MSVKLLPKSKIQELKANERSLEIREGAKLATRVDGLRELHAKTEQSLEQYRVSTLSAINEEITKLNTEKETLIGEVKLLRDEYEVLLPEIPLKREELAKFEKSLKSWEKKLEKREEKAALIEIDVIEALEGADNSRIHAEDDERISRNLIIQTNIKKQEAENVLNVAKSIQERVNREKRDIESSLNLRELGIETKEKELSRKEIELMNTKKQLDDETIKVADIKATLERSLARLKAGRRA